MFLIVEQLLSLLASPPSTLARAVIPRTWEAADVHSCLNRMFDAEDQALLGPPVARMQGSCSKILRGGGAAVTNMDPFGSFSPGSPPKRTFKIPTARLTPRSPSFPGTPHGSEGATPNRAWHAGMLYRLRRIWSFGAAIRRLSRRTSVPKVPLRVGKMLSQSGRCQVICRY